MLKLSFFLFLISIFIFSCTGEKTKANSGIPAPNKPDIGSLLWVNEFHSDSAVKEAVKHTLDNSMFIVAQLSWSPFDTSFFDNARWYHQLASEHNKNFMINLDWQNFSRSGVNGSWSFDEDTIQELFKADAMQLAKTYNPDVFLLGVEVNYYALTDSSGYKGFINSYNSVKTLLNKEYPAMDIGLSFQLELLYGIHTAWESKKTLDPLDAVVKNLDFIGVSTYPDQHHSSLQNVNASICYLDSLKSRYEVPLAISETGISRIKFDQGQRKKYITSIFDKADQIGAQFLIWGSMIDHPLLESWQNQIGLLEGNGFPKKEFGVWVKSANALKAN